MSATMLIVAGLVLLTVGGEMLLRGATRLASLLGLPPLMIGLTVVAFGTSAPELSVSISAAAGGAADVALGNVVGSTIFNVLAILGVSALVAPLVVSSRIVRIDVPLMAFAAVLTLVLSMDGSIGRGDGLFLVAGLLAYVAFNVAEARRGESAPVEAEFASGVNRRARGVRQLAPSLGWIVLGLAALVLGSDWLVEGAVSVARSLGISELIIGLTIVSVGTSLPEVAASIAAVLRGERDIAIGNVVGSNLFNLLGVLGISSFFAPGAMLVSAETLNFDFIVMLASCLACLPIFITGFRITRPKAALLLGFYGLYLSLVVLRATNSSAAPALMEWTLSLVLPATILLGAALFARAMREGAPPPG